MKGRPSSSSVQHVDAVEPGGVVGGAVEVGGGGAGGGNDSADGHEADREGHGRCQLSCRRKKWAGPLVVSAVNNHCWLPRNGAPGTGSQFGGGVRFVALYKAVKLVFRFPGQLRVMEAAANEAVRRMEPGSSRMVPALLGLNGPSVPALLMALTRA